MSALETGLGSYETATPLYELTSPPFPNDPYLQEQLPLDDAVRVQYEFFKELAVSIEHQHRHARTVNGPLITGLEQILKHCSKLLNAVDPTLPAEALFPETYQGDQVQHRVASLSAQQKRQLIRLTLAKRRAIDNLSNTYLERIDSQIVPAQILNQPPYSKQSREQECVAATMLMVLKDVSPGPISDFAFYNGLNDGLGSYLADDDFYLNLLESEALSRQINKAVGAISFFGADLNFVARIAQKVRERKPHAGIYCIVGLLSDSSPATWLKGIWHSNVLLAADEDTVLVHDPRRRPERRLDKRQFFERWMQAYAKGHIIVVEDDN